MQTEESWATPHRDSPWAPPRSQPTQPPPGDPNVTAQLPVLVTAPPPSTALEPYIDAGFDMGDGGWRRPGALLRTTALVVLALVGVLGVVAIVIGVSKSVRSEADATPSSVPTTAPPVAAVRPGVEPPKAGDWPAKWPRFGVNDRTKRWRDLEGLGFDPRLPESWECSKTTATADFVRYACGADSPDGEIGGDLIVRTCVPCGGDRRVALRQEVDAWGLQWVRAGGYLSWAETDRLDGQDRYALVMVGYWRSTAKGQIDRQVILHMTAPPQRADDLRKVANSLRSTLF